MILKNLHVLCIVCLWVDLVFAGSFADECLAAHNQYRRKHGVPDLKLDSHLNAVSQRWADTLAKTAQFKHRPNSKYGENIYYMWSSSRPSGAEAVKNWYDEVKKYNFQRPGFKSDTGHFTQVVWKGSKKLGCALATRGSESYVVANYSPAGNMQGSFPRNVFKES